MKPGRPLTFGRINQALYFGLPGNPVAVMVSFYLFVIPGLQRLRGEQVEPPLTFRAVTTTSLKKRAGRIEYQRGIIVQKEDGSLQVTKTGEQGSGILFSMSRANCFIILPSEITQVDAGTEVHVQLFTGYF
jgi:molybdopterin molybdotransferase